jgi:hypothetical protein
MKIFTRRVAALALSLAVMMPLPVAATDLQQNMQTAGTALSTLITYLYNDQRFREPANRDVILQQLDQLVSAMEATPGLLSDHDKIRLISQASVVHQLNDARQRFKQGDHATAQYLLAEAPLLCSSCHIQDGVAARHAPQLRREDFANDFSFAELNYFLRNYSVALESYERFLQSPGVGDSWIRGGKTLERLLDISLITEKDLAKTRERLQRYHQLPGLAKALKKTLSDWQGGIDALAGKSPSPSDMERQLAEEFAGLLSPKPESSLPEAKRPLALTWRATLQQHSNAVTTPAETARDLYLLAILDRLLGETELSLSGLYLKECIALKVPEYAAKCEKEAEERQQSFYGSGRNVR